MHDLNLLPTDFIEKEQWRLSALAFGRTVSLGLLVIILIYSISMNKISSVKQEISLLHQEQKVVQHLKEKLEALEQRREQLRLVEEAYQQVWKNESVSRISGILSQVIPPRVRIISLKINHTEYISLEGKARSNTDLATFMGKLNTFKQFKGAELLYANREQDGKNVYTRFEIKKDEKEK